jgi:hypothetical protein
MGVEKKEITLGAPYDKGLAESGKNKRTEDG